MSDVIFFKNNGILQRLERGVPPTELQFQELLVDHPELLGGSQLGHDGTPLRFLLIQREAGIEDGVAHANRWSVDHIFVDQLGVPTIVEVKRSTDTRIRREMVGQMLEYAANISSWWEHGQLRRLAAREYRDNLNTRTHDFLSGKDEDTEPDTDAIMDADSFWKEVDDNLQAGRVRLLFVADRVPAELRTIIQFLDESMPNVEVAGVEIGHYVHESSHSAYVPRVVGQSEKARVRRRKTSPSRLTNEQEFLEQVDETSASWFAKLFNETRRRGWTLYFGQKGFSVRVPWKGKLRTTFFGYPNFGDRIPHAFFHIERSKIPDELHHAIEPRLMDVGFWKPGARTYQMKASSSSNDSLQVLLDFAEQVERLGTADQNA